MYFHVHFFPDGLDYKADLLVVLYNTVKHDLIICDIPFLN